MSFFTKNDIIEMAVKMENNGYSYYNSALSRKDLTEEGTAVLTQLRDDEKTHEQTFLGLRNKIDKLDMGETISWEDAKMYMQTIVQSHVFDSSEKAIQLAAQAKNTEEILKNALQFEKDTLLFFYEMAKYVKGQKAEKAVNAIINEELKHIRRLRDLTADL